MTKIPFVLITGFLGSGKTTFLKNVARAHRTKRIGIVQNEFAPANIDGRDLQLEEGNFELLEINNGSVFCACLLGNFIHSLTAFVKKVQPDIVIMEASGLSDPIAIAELFNQGEISSLVYLSSVWTIVDGAKFIQYQQHNTRVTHQIRIADHVLINKSDISSNETIEQTERIIRDLNPFCNIQKTSYGSCHVEKLFELPTAGPVAMRKSTKQDGAVSSGRPEIGVGVIKTSRPISMEGLIELIDYYSKNTIRMKGFVKLKGGKNIALQSSYDLWNYKELDNYSGGTEIIAMGMHFNLSEFSKKFRALQNRN